MDNLVRLIESIELRILYERGAIHGLAGDSKRKLSLKEIEKRLLSETEIIKLDAIYHAGSISALLFVMDLLGRNYPGFEPYCDILK